MIVTLVASADDCTSAKYSHVFINKLETDEYEFKMDYDFIEYYGKSFLKNLNNITEFQDYLDYYDKLGEITLEKNADGDYILELPIPFSNQYELVLLKKVNISEMDELKIMIKKQNATIKTLQEKLNKIFDPQIDRIDIDYYCVNNKDKKLSSSIDFDLFKKFISSNMNKYFPADYLTENIIYQIKSADSYEKLNQLLFYTTKAGANVPTLSFLLKFLQENNYIVHDFMIFTPYPRQTIPDNIINDIYNLLFTELFNMQQTAQDLKFSIFVSKSEIPIKEYKVIERSAQLMDVTKFKRIPLYGLNINLVAIFD